MKKHHAVAALCVAAVSVYAQGRDEILLQGAITCNQKGLVGLAVALMKDNPSGSDATIAGMGCSVWNDGTRVSNVKIPEGLAAGEIEVTIHGERQWTLLSMLRRGA